MTTDPTSGTATEPIRSEFADDPDMAELVGFFVDEMSDRIASLESAASSEDDAQLAMLAHQMKGAAGGYGFPSISDCAATLERALKHDEKSISETKAELDDLISMCRRVSA